MTYLAVPIQVKNIEQACHAIESAVAGGAEMLELRLDYMQEISQKTTKTVVKAAKKTQKPIIATCRISSQGGFYTGNEADRLNLLRLAGQMGADYVDIELAAITGALPEFGGAKIIVSHHDFDKLPENFEKTLEKIKKTGPVVPKIVYMPTKISDSFAALDTLADNSGSIAMAMGEAGLVSRLLAKKLGAFLTFASLTEASNTAPGQVSLSQMKKMYRWDHISTDTRVFGVVGCPVAHSMSPAVHNAAFSAVGFDGIYLPLLVARDQFNVFLDGIRRRKWLGFKGLSVTIPHKHNALEYVKQCGGMVEPLALKIGAVNTILIDDDGEVSGFNTDYAGAMGAITDTLGIDNKDFKSMPTAIIGAGGVSRSLVAGLTDAGADVTIYNRTAEKAKRLADEFGCRRAGLDELQTLDAKLLINCTSIGMYPDIDASPVPGELIKGDMVVFDTVYNPFETKLLRHAGQMGAKIIDGVTMFVNQAALQFGMFTQLEWPQEVMRNMVEKGLATL